MELRHLRYFAAVAESGSFTLAADRLHVSQPTLSHQIKQLETMLGTALFDRAARKISLTAAGQLLLPYCQRTLKEADAGVLALSELEGLLRGKLQIGLFHAFSSSLMGRTLSEFAVAYPGVHVIARLLPRVEMERGLLQGQLDLAVSYASDDTEHIVAEPLFDEELALFVGSKHPLAKAAEIPMRKISELSLVLLTPEFAARQYVDRFLSEAGLRAHIVLEMNAAEPILATVRDSNLATILSGGAGAETRGIHIVRLTNPVPRRAASILWSRAAHRSAAARKMAEMIRAAYAPHR